MRAAGICSNDAIATTITLLLASTSLKAGEPDPNVPAKKK